MTPEFASATRPYEGETANGDTVIMHRAGGAVLFGVLDGLGHGPQAMAVATEAKRCIAAMTLEDDLETIFSTLDLALRATRGAAATLCLFRDPDVSACGIGNVDLRTQPQAIPFAGTPGILGRTLPRLRMAHSSITKTTRVYIFSDGIAAKMRVADYADFPLQHAADLILQQHGKATDDATVLVGEFLHT